MSVDGYTPRVAHVRALKSFNDFLAGQTYLVVVDEAMARLIVNHYLEEVHDGSSTDQLAPRP